MKSPEIGYKNRDILLSLKQEGLSDKQIGLRFGVSATSVRHFRLKFGIEVALNPGNTLYVIDEAFFSEINTEEKAYALGFITADGAVHKSGKCVSIAVQRQDKQILEDLLAAMGSNAEVRTKAKSDGEAMYVINLSRRRIVRDLESLGVYHDKSFTASFCQSVPPDLHRHYIRGLWDGDGWIGDRQFALVGTLNIVEGVRDAIYAATGHIGTIGLSRKGTSCYRLGFGRKASQVAVWMYAESSIKLGRKYAQFLRCWA